jgi:hypothetical protein
MAVQSMFRSRVSARFADTCRCVRSWNRAALETGRIGDVGDVGEARLYKSGLREERRLRQSPLQLAYANRILWFFSGNVRMRCPVAAKIALSTAGAATKIVGSPTPPQNPPDGMMMHSTLGMSLMRIDS